MLFSNKKGISLSMMEEILGFDEVEQTYSATRKEILKQEEVGLTIHSTSYEVFALFDEPEFYSLYPLSFCNNIS